MNLTVKLKVKIELILKGPKAITKNMGQFAVAYKINHPMLVLVTRGRKNSTMLSTLTFLANTRHLGHKGKVF
jgi:hypothetical protein